MLIEELDTPTELYLVMELVKVESHDRYTYYILQKYAPDGCLVVFLGW